jgi:hypothetical protein
MAAQYRQVYANHARRPGIAASAHAEVRA